MDISEDELLTPPDISEIAKEVSLDLLPRKSKNIYEKKYKEFVDWCTEKEIKKISENVLLAYFSKKSKLLKPSSLWSTYSMLKSTLKVKKDIDISVFYKLISFLKQQSVGYKATKSKTLSDNDVTRFLLEAPNKIYLMKKVVLIFGIAGACRRDELVKLEVSDVEEKDSVIIVTISDTKTHKTRIFTITNNGTGSSSLDYLKLCRQYFSLRPKNPTTNRLFINYRSGACTNQPVGMNTIAKIPSEIAHFLGLPEPARYTGHCFRRTSATLLVNGGGNITQLKRHGGWKSTSVAEGYIDDSLTTKNATSHKILRSPRKENNNPSLISVEIPKNIHQNQNLAQKNTESIGSGLLFQNCNNCTFNITINNHQQ